MTITVCIGSSCHLKGSREVIQKLEKLIKEHHIEEAVEMKGSFCMGNCIQGVSVKLDEELYSLSADTVEEFFNSQVLPRV